jgi:methyl-accepting chemotaxis protein
MDQGLAMALAIELGRLLRVALFDARHRLSSRGSLYLIQFKPPALSTGRAKTMSDLDVDALETSFDLVADRSNGGVDLVSAFYRNLFAEYPETKALFAETDMAQQEKALLGALGTIRATVRNQQPRLAVYLTELGARHAGFGVRDEHYAEVGAVLLDTLRAFGGEDWEPRYTEAWTTAYGAVAIMMRDGAKAALS